MQQGRMQSIIWVEIVAFSLSVSFVSNKFRIKPTSDAIVDAVSFPSLSWEQLWAVRVDVINFEGQRSSDW